MRDLAVALIFVFALLACQRAEKVPASSVQSAQGGPDQSAGSAPTHPGSSEAAGYPAGAPHGSSADSPPIMQKIAEYKGRLEKNSKDIEALVYLGNANYDIQRFEQAQQYYQRALDVDQNNTHVRTDLASSFRQMGQIDRAIAELKKVLLQDPNQQVALYNLGVILLNDKEDRSGAIDAWKKLVAIYQAKEAKYALLSGEKKAFLKAFGHALIKAEVPAKVNIDEVGRASGVSADQYHKWLNEDTLFSEALRDAKDAAIADELESKIQELGKGEPLKPQG